MNHAHNERERLKNNILNSYSNKDSILIKEISLESFKKSYLDNDFLVISNDVMKAHSLEIIEKANKIEDKFKKNELIEKSIQDVDSYEKIIVKGSNSIELFFVKSTKS